MNNLILHQANQQLIIIIISFVIRLHILYRSFDMKKVGIISKISHENLQSIVLMQSCKCQFTDYAPALDYLIMIDSLSLCLKVSNGLSN